MRIRLILKCESCKSKNYMVSKNKSKQQQASKPMIKGYKKYCKFCRKSIIHKEEKAK